MFEIEKGVEIIKLRGRDSKYPFRLMDIGDSFFVPCEKGKKEAVQRSLSQCARHSKPLKFITRQLDDGVRCWRSK
jgi:hypothetical protein